MNFKIINTIGILDIYFYQARFAHNKLKCERDMSEVILEKPNNNKRRDCLIVHPDSTRTKVHKPLAFSHPEDLTNACLMENKKAAILERLEYAVEKLKDARKEIHEAILAAQEIDFSITACILTVNDVPLEERRREAEKQLYLLRYE